MNRRRKLTPGEIADIANRAGSAARDAMGEILGTTHEDRSGAFNCVSRALAEYLPKSSAASHDVRPGEVWEDDDGNECILVPGTKPGEWRVIFRMPDGNWNAYHLRYITYREYDSVIEDGLDLSPHWVCTIMEAPR